MSSRSAKPDTGLFKNMDYHAPSPSISAFARSQGKIVVGGVEAMIWQGVEQQRLWLGVEEKDLPIDEILDTVRKQVASDIESGSKPPLK
ncbi:hypothetical protein JCM8208_006448 [Rhodotorula glutinis]